MTKSPIVGLNSPAWDVWMLFALGIIWEAKDPPAPGWWEHQLSRLTDHADRWLDPDRFAEKAVEMSSP